MEDIAVPIQEEPHKDNIWLGIGLVCAGFFLVTAMGALSKLLTDIHNPVEIAFYRNTFCLIVACAFIFKKKRYDLLRPKKPVFWVLRGLIGAAGLLACVSTLQALPMSTTTVLFFASTLMVPVFATFLLKEKVGIHRWSAVAIGMVGVVIVAQPSAEISLMGVGLGLLSAFFIACAHIILRFLRNENSLTVTMAYFIFGVIVPLPFMPFIGHMPTFESALILVGIGVTGGLFQYLLTLALKYAPASLLNPFNYTGLLWSTGFDLFIWHHVPGWPVFIGGAIIISANLYIVHREHQISRKRKAL